MSKSTVAKRTMPLLVRNLKDTLNTFLDVELADSPGVAFTSDIWRSRAMTSFISLTVHLIDRNFEMRRFVLACRPFDVRSSSDRIQEVLDTMITDQKMSEGTVLTMVTDAASNFKRAVADSPVIDDHHICLCHVINLALQDCLNQEEIKPTMDIIRRLAKATHQSTIRTNLIREECQKQDVSFIKIIQPVVTRWSSMVMCLQSVLKIAPVLKALRDHRDFSTDKGRLIPSNKEFDLLQGLLGPLEFIMDIQTQLQADLTPTAQKYIPSLFHLCLMTESKMYRESSSITQTVVAAFENGIKQRVQNFGKVSQNFCLANLLHPSLKGKHLKLRDGKDESFQKTLDFVRSCHPDKEQEKTQDVSNMQ